MIHLRYSRQQKRNCGFLGYCIVYYCSWIPKFRRNLLPPSLGLQQCPPKLWYSTTTLHGVTTHKTTNYFLLLLLATHLHLVLRLKN